MLILPPEPVTEVSFVTPNSEGIIILRLVEAAIGFIVLISRVSLV